MWEPCASRGAADTGAHPHLHNCPWTLDSRHSGKPAVLLLSGCLLKEKQQELAHAKMTQGGSASEKGSVGGS